MLAVIVAAALLQGPGAPPPARYHLEVRTLQELDRTGSGGTRTSNGLTTTATITVAMTDSAGGQLASIVVDSMQLDPTGAIVDELRRHPTAAQDARGASVRVYIARGKIQGGVQLSDSTNPALAAIVQSVAVLFPGIRRGAKVGDSWADTSHINNSAGPRRVTGEIVATWRVVGNEGDALILDGTSTTRSKSEDGSGQSLTLAGSSKERVVIAPNGLAKRASITTNNDMSIAVPSQNTTIPGKTTASLTLTPLP